MGRRGIISSFKWFLPAFATRRGGGGARHHVLLMHIAYVRAMLSVRFVYVLRFSMSESGVYECVSTNSLGMHSSAARVYGESTGLRKYSASNTYKNICVLTRDTREAGHLKGAQAWDIRSLGFSWFLHHKVSTCGRLRGWNKKNFKKYLGVHLGVQSSLCVCSVYFWPKKIFSMALLRPLVSVKNNFLKFLLF